MKLPFFNIIFLLLITLTGFTQVRSLTIDNIYGDNFCASSTLKIPFTTNFTPANDNVFSVKIRLGGSTQTYTAAVKTIGNPLEIILPSDLPEGGYQMQINTSSPANEGFWSNYFYTKQRPVVSILNSTVESSPYELINIPITGQNSIGPYNEFRMVINDSIVVAEPEFQVFPDKNTTYKLTSVSNLCGQGQVSGTFNVVVKAFGFKIISVVPSKICRGDTALVHFSANGKFEANNSFQVQVTDAQNKFINLPTFGTKSPLKVLIPENFTEEMGQQMRIVATAPQLMSDITGSRETGGYPAIGILKPTAATLQNASYAIRWGEKIQLVFAAEENTHEIVFTNGKDKIEWTSDFNTNLDLTPTQGGTYRISEVRGMCGTVNSGMGAVVVGVSDGIVLGNARLGVICDNEKMVFPIKTNMRLIANTPFLMQLSRYADESPNSPYAAYVPGVFRNDSIYVTFTAEAKKKIAYDYPSITSFQARVLTTDRQVLSSYGESIVLDEPPKFFYFDVCDHYGSGRCVGYGRTELQLDAPHPILIGLPSPQGLNDISLTIKMGEERRIIKLDKNNSGSTIYDFVTSDKTYTIESVSNRCGVGEVTTKPITVKVAPTPAFVIRIDPKSFPAQVCEGTTIDVKFQIEGKTEANTDYEIQLVSSGGERQKLLTTKELSVKIKLPNVPYDNGYFVQVVSANNRSDLVPIRIRTLPEIAFEGNQSIIKGDSVLLVFSPPRGLYETIEMSDGRIIKNASNQSDFRFWVKPAQTTSYFIKSVTNVCGTVTNSSKVFRVKVQPYLLYATDHSGNRHTTQLNNIYTPCTGNTIAVGYVSIGNVPADESLVVQIADYDGNANVYQDLTIIKRGNPLIVALPANATLINKQLQIISRKYGIVSENSLAFSIFELPTATLSSPTNNNVLLVEPNGNAALNLKFTGSSPWIVGIENYDYDNRTNAYQKNEFNDYHNDLLPISPTKRTTYKMVMVRNACGYGTATGSVQARVKPNIIITKPQNFVSACRGQSVVLEYNSSGEYEANNTFKVELYDTNIVLNLLANAPSKGTISVKIPDTLRAGNYGIRIASSNPAIEANIGVLVSQPPVVVLSGSTIINAGETATLRITGSGNAPFSYKLSDGQTGQIYSLPEIITVKPSTTTTYTLSAFAGACAAERISGQAIVTVNAASSKTVQTIAVSGVLCGGEVILVEYLAKGLASNATFQLQMSDAEGNNFVVIPSKIEQNILQATIPANTPVGVAYRFRVVANDPAATASANTYPLTIGQKATASITGPSFSTPNQPLKFEIRLTGSSPWEFQFGERGKLSGVYALQSPIVLQRTPAQLPATYEITGLINGCGVGQITGSNAIQVELLTALSSANTDGITVYPNPVVGHTLVIKTPTVSQKTIEIYDMGGRKLQSVTMNDLILNLNVSDLAAGGYIVQIANKNAEKIAVFKVIKM